ncbi:probable serine hydrolase [Scaptodrosophila lebanonensis]|uniref:Probable serine hydrolase n=1 Tax=Drosophila lebanonensis TaxID=7225 RepID=A0A6J2T9D2_DROLE|nr:probable serine hydrolase [Scaptodrosophila lebanonensis]
MSFQKGLRLLTQMTGGSGTQNILRHNSSNGSARSLKMITKHYDEITIPVPWGHIAGKWYGPKHVRPILGMHGWQDNAGTFDTLAPLLPPHLSFLSIDCPGHGLSSWLPPGIIYHSIDYVLLIRRIMEEYNWDKVSIMGHSMSSINGFVFSALFPDKVDMFIGLDVLKPPIRSPRHIVTGLSERLENALKVERRNRIGTEPPAYEWDQLVERLHLGTDKSVSMEACKFLLQRNAKPSTHEPHKYYFSRDSRLKNSLFYTLSIDVPLEMASRITCPHLFIKAKQAPYYERKEYYDATLAALRKNSQFEYHEVDGTHHVHLNEPEKVASIINSFINKCRPL